MKIAKCALALRCLQWLAIRPSVMQCLCSLHHWYRGDESLLPFPTLKWLCHASLRDCGVSFLGSRDDCQQPNQGTSAMLLHTASCRNGGKRTFLLGWVQLAVPKLRDARLDLGRCTKRVHSRLVFYGPSKASSHLFCLPDSKSGLREIGLSLRALPRKWLKAQRGFVQSDVRHNECNSFCLAALSRLLADRVLRPYQTATLEQA